MAGGGERKIGGNKKGCEYYQKSGRQEINKKRRMLRHLRNHPNDQSTASRAKALFGVNEWPLTCRGLKRDQRPTRHERRLARSQAHAIKYGTRDKPLVQEAAA